MYVYINSSNVTLSLGKYGKKNRIYKRITYKLKPWDISVVIKKYKA